MTDDDISDLVCDAVSAARDNRPVALLLIERRIDLRCAFRLMSHVLLCDRVIRSGYDDDCPDWYYMLDENIDPHELRRRLAEVFDALNVIVLRLYYRDMLVSHPN